MNALNVTKMAYIYALMQREQGCTRGGGEGVWLPGCNSSPQIKI